MPRTVSIQKEMISRLKKKYQQKIVPLLKKELGISNDLAVPRIKKVIVNMGIGDIGGEEKTLRKAVETFKMMTGQKPRICRAKKSIAEFKTRRGDPIGLKATLRRNRMYQFLDRLFSLALPQVKDFQGVKRKAFDNQANYTLGLKEQIIFPEVDYDKIDKVRGLEITLLTSTKDQQKALRLLELMGMPFEKKEGRH